MGHEPYCLHIYWTLQMKLRIAPPRVRSTTSHGTYPILLFPGTLELNTIQTHRTAVIPKPSRNYWCSLGISIIVILAPETLLPCMTTHGAHEGRTDSSKARPWKRHVKRASSPATVWCVSSAKARMDAQTRTHGQLALTSGWTYQGHAVQ
jgi:hypothetical protein